MDEYLWEWYLGYEEPKSENRTEKEKCVEEEHPEQEQETAEEQ